MTVLERDEPLARARVPGEPGIWVLIFGDMTLFAFLLLTYLGYRSQDAALFARSQQELDTGLGATYTLLLLTSSLFVVLALRRIRVGLVAVPWVAGAMACGASFAVLKAFEYQAKVEAGFIPESNRFFLFYFLLTGVHLLHLVLGLGVLCYLAVLARRAGALTPREVSYAEACACFWHMLDLLWIVIFPLLYLVR